MTVAEAVADAGALPAAVPSGHERTKGGRNGGRVARLRERIHEQRRLLGATDTSLPPGVFSRVADDPDETDDIRTVGGYVSLPYAAALFEVDRQRLQQAVWRGALPGVKTDSSRTAPWMVRVRDVARFLARNRLLADQPQGGRPPGARNLSPGERRFGAATLELWRQRHAPWMTPEESVRLGDRLAAEMAS